MCNGKIVTVMCPCTNVNCSSKNPYVEGGGNGHLIETLTYIEPCKARENKPQRPSTYPRYIRWSDQTQWYEEICEACYGNGCPEFKKKGEKRN
jgi:hypothetical protein